MGVNKFVGYGDYGVGWGGCVIIISSLHELCCIVCLDGCEAYFVVASLLPLMFVPIIPVVGSEGLYANNISPLHIPILWRGPWSGGDITCG